MPAINLLKEVRFSVKEDEFFSKEMSSSQRNFFLSNDIISCERKLFHVKRNDFLWKAMISCERKWFPDKWNDFKAIELNISRMSKQKFQTIVKSAALEYLNKLKQKHKKMKYQKLELQPYFSSPLFNNESRNLLLRLRTRTVNGVQSVYGGLYSYTSCPLHISLCLAKFSVCDL